MDFIYGSIIMVFMNFIVRIIGFTYEVLLSKLLGAESMGLFQISLSTLMLFLIFTTSGIPTIVTKMIAEYNSKNDNNTIRIIYNYIIIIVFIIALVLCNILLFSSSFIAENIFKNSNMELGLYLLAPAIVLISISNIMKAYFYGIKNVIIPSIGEIIEHTSRLVIVIGILLYFKPSNPIMGVSVAIIGISIGELFNILWILLISKPSKNNAVYGKKENFVILKILINSLPLTITGILGVVLRYSNIILLPNRLIAAGYSNSESIATLGRIGGMAMPLISLPFIVTSALVVNIIPNITEKSTLRRYKEIDNDIMLAIKSTLIISIPLTLLFIILAKPISIFFYSDILVSDIIRIMGFGTLVLSLQHIYSGILYGLNKQFNVMKNNLIGLILRVVLLYILVGNPKYGINGFYISFYVSELIIITLNVLALKRLVSLKFNYWDLVGKPVIGSLFMIALLHLSSYKLEDLHYANTLAFVSSIFVALFSYLFILVVTKAIPKNFIKKMLKSR